MCLREVRNSSKADYGAVLGAAAQTNNLGAPRVERVSNYSVTFPQLT